MYFGNPWPWGGKAKPDKKAKMPHETDSNHERINHNERQTNGRFEGLGNGVLDVLNWLKRILLHPLVLYLLPWVLFGVVVLVVGNWLLKSVTSGAPGGNFLATTMTLAMAVQPAVAWQMVVVAFFNVAPSILNWWSADSTHKTTSTIPEVRFISPISAEQAFVVPEYLKMLEQSRFWFSFTDGNSGPPPAMKQLFTQAKEEAKLLKGIHDGPMTDMGLKFAWHYDLLAQLHVDIEMAIIDIDDRDETQTSFGGWFKTDMPKLRANSHHRILLWIADDMIEAGRDQIKIQNSDLAKLDQLVTPKERHGAICGLRSNVLKSIQSSSTEANDIRAEARVLCSSSKRSKVKLRMALDALNEHLISIGASRKTLAEMQHDQTKTLEAALLAHCKSLLKAMVKLAESGNE
ncbi:hypothetical protein N0V84_000926 [Fusarium piperis]|uniref:Uncharacterized protein n=1 Tax=Fusarium piperis TaxID=1435070 RepID=A0A9W9BUB1_9HYPO|nr:hypothetical protein N0V84_000926 [Fusarium piperis]